AALVPMLVPRDHLANAITLNTIMFQTASVVGPAAAGIVIAQTGVGMTYALNGVSFGFVIVALLMMRDVPQTKRTSGEGVRNDVSWSAAMEGLRFDFQSPLMRSTMLLDFFPTYFASATSLRPVFAHVSLHL